MDAKTDFTHWLTHLALIISLTALAACTPSEPPTPTSPPAHTLAAEHAAAGEYTAAESAYRAALREHPDDAGLALDLAELYRAWGRPTRGLAALEEAVRRGAPSQTVTPLRLDLLAQAGDWDRIIELANTRVDDAQALRYLAAAYLHTYRCDEAFAAAERWHNSYPNDADATGTLGLLRQNTALICEGAPAYCELAQSCAPNCAATLGLAHVRTADWALAACTLARAAELNPANAEVQSWLGESLARLGFPDAAERHFTAALNLDPDAPLTWLLLGKHYLRQQETAVARRALLKAHHLDPDNPAICLAIAELKALEGKYVEVETWTEAALASAPDDVEVWKAAARLYLSRHLRRGLYPAQAAEIAQLLAPNDAEAHMLYGWALLQEGKTLDALNALDRAVDLAPGLGEAHYLRALTLQRRGETKAAQAAFTRAADLGYWP